MLGWQRSTYRYTFLTVSCACLLMACGTSRVAVIPQPTQPAIHGSADESVPTATPLPTVAATATEANGTTAPDSATPGDAANGEAIFNGTILVAGASPCVACHMVSGDVAVVGPNLAGIANRAAERVPDSSAAEYLRVSIIDPNSYIVEGYSEGIMPLNYADTLTEEQINDLVAYLLSLD